MLIKRLLISLVIAMCSITIYAQQLTVNASSNGGVLVDDIFHVLENSEITYNFSFDPQSKIVTEVINSSYSYGGTSSGTLSTSLDDGSISVSKLTINAGASSTTLKKFESAIEFWTGDSVQVNDSTKEWKAQDTKLKIASNSLSIHAWPLASSDIVGKQNVAVQGVADGLSWKINSKGGYDQGWTTVWKYNGKEYYGESFTMPYYLNDTGETQVLTVSVTTKNLAPDGKTEWYSKKWDDIKVTVKACPVVYLEKNEIAGYSGGQITATVKTTSPEPESTWSFIWSFEGKSYTTNEPKVTFDLPTISGHTSQVKKLNVKTKNIVNSVDQTVIGDNLDINVSIFSTGEASITQVDSLVVYAGSPITLTTNTKGGYPSGWRFIWMDNGKQFADNQNSTYSFLPNNSSGNPEVHTYSVTAINAIDGQVGSETSFNFKTVELWPACVFPQSMTLYDVEQDASRNFCGIREGNSFKLCVEGYSGGYSTIANDTWSESWSADGSNFSTSDVVPTEIVSNGSTMASSVMKYSVAITNYGPFGNIWDRKILNQDVTIYHKPMTPIGLTKKGNGTSGTMIATSTYTDSELANYDYYLVFGYEDAYGTSHDNTPVKQETGTTRYGQFSSSVLQNSSNIFYVYSLWRYNDGAEITSGKRYISYSDESWDGSTYGETRAYEDASSGIEDVSVDINAADEFFSLQGHQLDGLKHGINVIRAKDGSISKVYIK